MLSKPIINFEQSSLAYFSWLLSKAAVKTTEAMSWVFVKQMNKCQWIIPVYLFKELAFSSLKGLSK